MIILIPDHDHKTHKCSHVINTADLHFKACYQKQSLIRTQLFATPKDDPFSSCIILGQRCSQKQV